MSQILLYSILFLSGFWSIITPSVGVVLYYILAVLGPQYIWWWQFENVRSSFIIILFLSLGTVYKIFSGELVSKFIFNKLNFFMLVLWISVSISHFFGGYNDIYIGLSSYTAELFYRYNVVFFVYFISIIVIDSKKNVKFLSIVVIVSVIYLTYWANHQYLSQNWFQFRFGRLMGPFSPVGGSIYKDENTFAMLFVVGVPFLYYLATLSYNRILKYSMWLVIPLSWHAIFLTGSRGGLVGIGFVTLMMLFLSERKVLVLPLLIFFLIFFQWQAGDSMKERSESISVDTQESSAQQRLKAWEGGFKMLADYPLSGVGLGMFKEALPLYVDTNKRVAHNTFIQYLAESGIFAGISYLSIIFLFFKNSFQIKNKFSGANLTHNDLEIVALNNASTVAFSGFVVCSLFLSLNTYEIFFLLILINNTLAKLLETHLGKELSIQ